MELICPPAGKWGPECFLHLHIDAASPPVPEPLGCITEMGAVDWWALRLVEVVLLVQSLYHFHQCHRHTNAFYLHDPVMVTCALGSLFFSPKLRLWPSGYVPSAGPNRAHRPSAPQCLLSSTGTSPSESQGSACYWLQTLLSLAGGQGARTRIWFRHFSQERTLLYPFTFCTCKWHTRTPVPPAPIPNAMKAN